MGDNKVYLSTKGKISFGYKLPDMGPREVAYLDLVPGKVNDVDAMLWNRLKSKKSNKVGLIERYLKSGFIEELGAPDAKPAVKSVEAVEEQVEQLNRLAATPKVKKPKASQD